MCLLWNIALSPTRKNAPITRTCASVRPKRRVGASWRMHVHCSRAVDPLRQVSLVAQITRQAYEPLASELELLRPAGAVAPDLADLGSPVEARRRQKQARLIASLHEARALRPEIEAQEATDVLWALTSYDLYRMLVIEQHWGPQRYETWLAQLLVQHLLASR